MSSRRRHAEQQRHVYDDTGRSSRTHHSQGRRRTPRQERRMTSRPVDPMFAMFEQFDRDVAAFHDSFFPAMNSMFDRMPSGSSSYMYEATTSSMGPDGRTTTETIRSRTGRDGRPETRRYFRDADGRETTETTSEPPPNPFNDFGWHFRAPFGGGGGAFGFGNLPAPPHAPAPAPPAVVRDVTDEEERASRRMRRSSRVRPRVTVEEPDDDDEDAAPRRRYRGGRGNQAGE